MDTCNRIDNLEITKLCTLNTIPTIKIKSDNSTDDAKLHQELNNNSNTFHCCSPQSPADEPKKKDSTPEFLTQRIVELGAKIKWIKMELQSFKQQDQILTRQFKDIGEEIQHLHSLIPSSPFTSSESVYSIEEHSDKSDLRDQCEYEFRGRTSSLLLPQRNTYLSPNLQRKATTNLTLSRLTRPKSLTHLNKDYES